ncbi:ABC transporter permease [Saccharopolyspora oryzae]|uniref:ABC transporter permease n=1 Tax=Saccharopolyspora oryzae TaxID=2997343 RepID=A0ABT4URZ9_9PSEU|nr:ABC transporter permease [Saccharopolyspora oryzae]MDA3624490.1 ABC transporter permease [Saccharopolyspora oryzae]
MAETTLRTTEAGQWRPAGRSRTARAHPRARFWGSLVALAVLVLAAFAVPVLFGSESVRYDSIRLAPSPAHPFGTDSSGRDLFVQSLTGLRISLLVAGFSALVSTVLGSLVGAVAGSAGGWADRLLMRLVDVVNSVPHLLLGIVIVALYRGSLTAVILSISLTHWTTVARIVRSEVLSLRSRPYVDAAIAGGSSRWRILVRHLLPAIVPQAALSAVLLVPHAVWHETALSFLGLGLPPHLASIGNILGDGREAVLLGAWWIVLFPSLLLVATTLAVSGLAATWRDRVVPRRRSELAL